MFGTCWTMVALTISLGAGALSAAGQAAARPKEGLHASTSAARPGMPAGAARLSPEALNRAPTAQELEASAGPGIMHA